MCRTHSLSTPVRPTQAITPVLVAHGMFQGGRTIVILELYARPGCKALSQAWVWVETMNAMRLVHRPPSLRPGLPPTPFRSRQLILFLIARRARTKVPCSPQWGKRPSTQKCVPNQPLFLCFELILITHPPLVLSVEEAMLKALPALFPSLGRRVLQQVPQVREQLETVELRRLRTR